MNAFEWSSAIEDALSEDSAGQMDRSGKTPYDDLGICIGERTGTGNASANKEVADFVAALISVARKHKSTRSARWWSGLFGLLSCSKGGFSEMQLSQLIDAFEPEWQQIDLFSRAAMLTGISAYVRLDWDRIKRQDTYKNLVADYPLYIADAMFSSGAHQSAIELVSAALAVSQVSAEDAQSLLSLWRERTPPSFELGQVEAFLERLRKSKINAEPKKTIYNAMESIFGRRQCYEPIIRPPLAAAE